MKNPFTKLQGQYLAYIVTYTKLHRRPIGAAISGSLGVAPGANI